MTGTSACRLLGVTEPVGLVQVAPDDHRDDGGDNERCETGRVGREQKTESQAGEDAEQQAQATPDCGRGHTGISTSVIDNCLHRVRRQSRTAVTVCNEDGDGPRGGVSPPPANGVVRAVRRVPVGSGAARDRTATVINRQVTTRGMVSGEFEQFLIGAAVLMVAALVAGAALAPPDPFTQVAVVAVSLPVVLVGSYVIAYRREFEWM